MTMVIAAIRAVLDGFHSAYECVFVRERFKTSMESMGKAFAKAEEKSASGYRVDNTNEP
jgi:hypothetical protein